VVNFIIEPRNYVKNQIVYREGDEADTIFIVQVGDFEASRKYQPQVDYSKMRQEEIKPGRPSDAGTHVIIDRQVRSVETFKLALMGPGQMFGDDDLLFNRPYSSSVVCRSSGGTLLKINGAELLKKMRANEECWRLFQDYIKHKEATFRLRLSKIDHVFHKEPVIFSQKDIEEQAHRVRKEIVSLASSPVKATNCETSTKLN